MSSHREAEPKQNPGKPGSYFGATEDKNLEPLHSITDWLLDNPDINWLDQLAVAAATPYTQAFVY